MKRNGMKRHAEWCVTCIGYSIDCNNLLPLKTHGGCTVGYDWDYRNVILCMGCSGIAWNEWDCTHVNDEMRHYSVPLTTQDNT